MPQQQPPPQLSNPSESEETLPQENVLIHPYINRDEILHGRDSEAPLTPKMEYNLGILLTRLNKFRSIYGKPMRISSGYRTPSINSRVGGAPNSPHLMCEAADIADADGSLKKYIAANPSILEDCNLYQEDPTITTSWVHLDIRPRARRVFYTK